MSAIDRRRMLRDILSGGAPKPTAMQAKNTAIN
jgi:hypothetical protein